MHTAHDSGEIGPGQCQGGHGSAVGHHAGGVGRRRDQLPLAEVVAGAQLCSVFRLAHHHHALANDEEGVQEHAACAGQGAGRGGRGPTPQAPTGPPP